VEGRGGESVGQALAAGGDLFGIEVAARYPGRIIKAVGNATLVEEAPAWRGRGA
jgi:hypothetical protein